MASVVPISFYGFLSKPKTFVREICRREVNGERLLTPSITSMNFSPQNCSDKGIGAVNRSCFHMVVLARNICEPISPYFNVITSAHFIISGFWVGPDFEDGWGFVEAFVHRI